MKLELLANATVVDDAIKFISRSQGNLKLPSSNGGKDDEESNEPDNEEDHREEENEKIAATTNDVF